MKGNVKKLNNLKNFKSTFAYSMVLVASLCTLNYSMTVSRNIGEVSESVKELDNSKWSIDDDVALKSVVEKEFSKMPISGVSVKRSQKLGEFRVAVDFEPRPTPSNYKSAVLMVNIDQTGVATVVSRTLRQ